MSDSFPPGGSGIIGVVGLAPGRTAKKTAQGLGEVPSDVRCRITEVRRTPSLGWS